MDKIIMKEPLISVLLCTYNDEKYIYKAVKSILDQTFEDFEFIVRDKILNPCQKIGRG